MAKVDYCGIVSGKDTDKSSLFALFYGDLKTAPMIKEASLNLECSLVRTIEFHTNYFFIGEIKGTYALGVRQCQRMFRDLGFRFRKPRPKMAHADPEQQATYKKTP
jgi:flavin reductase (DIM6/NTAB) family NADH-FMN oxidoreductase RutF